ncbi:acetyltransferase [Rossellomorea aquimaris]|uniref:Acetyltransferase n=1 Tax=Rossellomorea aquimaris TaxID=189382 RepID=A0A1J6WI25_9BACI|nr:acetyltransferase [Rossellomorea aquimaris]OIU67647.1 acetyltransferase [Rossellomorea aquimaris]
MKEKLLILGASGHGKVVADIALKMNRWQSVAFLDDNKNINSSMGLEVIDTSSEVSKYIEEYEVFVGIGNNITRQKVQEKLETLGVEIPVLIHPTAVIGEQVEIENGTALMAGTIVNCCTRIGRGCIVNTGSTIDHDNCIEDFVHVSPGANLAGTVYIGKRSWLGIGSVVSNNINITSDCKLGAGSVVIKDITDPGVYVGAPVRRV